MEKRTIGSFLAALRKAKGLTQRELAEMLNVSDKAVSRWERDESYPDLTMIPVLAEIFGVSCDELLRGARINSEEQQAGQQQKTEKQIGYLVERVRANFMVTSVWIYALTVFGFIAALICNIGFNRAYIGFFLACAFYTAGLVWLAIKLITSFSALKYESELQLIDRIKEKIIRAATANAAVILVFLAAVLPLTMTYNTAWGLDIDSWLEYGLPFAAVAAMIGLLAAAIVPRICVRSGVYTSNERRIAADKLRLKYTAICAAVFSITLAAQLAANYDTLAFADEIKFDNTDDYVKFMETPTEASDFLAGDTAAPHDSPAGNDPVDYTESRELRTRTIEAPDGSVVCTFAPLNENVCRTRITWSGNEITSISVVTLDQLHAAQARQQSMNSIFTLVYIAETAAFFLLYVLYAAKKKKI